MEKDKKTELLRELFDEYRVWYESLVMESNLLPRSVSGVAEDGRQFIYMIEDLELHHMARNKYLRYILDAFGSVVYAYAGIAMRGDSDAGEIEEVLEIVSADAGHYVMGSWLILRDRDGAIFGLQQIAVREGDDPEQHPSTWFLSGAVRFNETEKSRYALLFEAASPGIVFTDRNVAL